MPLSGPTIARLLMRLIPFGAQRTFVNPALAPAGTLVAQFDLALGVTDANQLLAGAPPGAGIQHAIGPWLDVVAFSSQAGQFAVDYAVDNGASYRNVTTTGVPASTLTNVSMLRVTARYVRVTFTNLGGVAAAVEFGAYVRSS